MFDSPPPRLNCFTPSFSFCTVLTDLLPLFGVPKSSDEAFMAKVNISKIEHIF